MSTLQSDIAVQYANQIANIVQQMRNIRVNVAEIQAINANTPLGNLWNALNTTALAGDGSLGTADATPVTTHPVDPRVYPALNRGQVSATQLASGLALVLAFDQLMAGTAVSSNGAAPATINALSM